MPGAIDKAMSVNTMQMAAGVRDNDDLAAPDANITGGGDIGGLLQALSSGQLGAEQLLQLLALMSQGGQGPGAGMPGPAPAPMGPPPMGPGAGGPIGPGGPIDEALLG